MITADRSWRTTVLVCDCGWRALVVTTSPVRAWRVARDHEAAAHPGLWQASNALNKAATRR